MVWWEQGTTLHHARTLAVQHLARSPGLQPVVLVVDRRGAHCPPGSDGHAIFGLPASPATLHATVAAPGSLERAAAPIHVLRASAALPVCRSSWTHRPPAVSWFAMVASPTLDARAPRRWGLLSAAPAAEVGEMGCGLLPRVRRERARQRCDTLT